jgi:hypothetical protein
MNHHLEEPRIQLILVVDFLKVILEDPLLILDLFLAEDHLVRLRKNLDPFKEDLEVLSLQEIIINGRRPCEASSLSHTSGAHPAWQ